jgi:hypothetical protein
MNRLNRTVCFALSLSALGLTGCEEDDFDPGSRVTDFRVLAVQADQPYARPGETVHFSALSHDPSGRPVTWAWAACVNPASSSVEGCIEDVLSSASGGGSPILATGVGQSSLDYTIPADALTGVDPDALPLALTGILSVACPGELTLANSGSTAFTCVESGTGREMGLDEYVVGVKRVFMRTSDRNQNPVISRITFDGADWAEGDIKEVDGCDIDDNTFDDCSSSLRHEMAAIATPESFESGVDQFGNDFAEQVIAQYYATEGIFEDDMRIAEDPETRWVARNHASGRTLDVWFVVRDDRGGVTWATRQVRVR